MSNDITNTLGYTFKNKKWLEAALIHPSALSKKNRNCEFERLEFLGDRVLGLIIAEFVFHKYPQENEGVLARYQSVLVSRDICRKIGEGLGLQKFLKYNVKDYQSANTALVANAMEAIIGAMFLDGGIVNCRDFIYKHWSQELVHTQSKDPKTIVQEWAQKKYNLVPEYTLIEKSGSDHSPVFTYKIFVEPEFESLGTGYNRKQAEQDAALNFIKKYTKQFKSV